MTENGYRKFDHDAHARAQAPDDFWGQIRRTVNGKPVSEAQIGQIVSSIKEHLDFAANDVLLDLACGNGALSSRLFDSCAGCLGVDMSDYLVEVAQKYFQKAPAYVFVAQGAKEYVESEDAPGRFSKVLCYGSFSYFSEDDARTVLRALHDKFRAVERVFIGNLPDKEKASSFYKDKPVSEEELGDNQSQIGIWRTRQEFEALAAEAGWRIQFSVMPPDFYAAYYRYDVLLTR
jgi:cyclopropane fatty-acyl-phospholipid synthase-like methyltransferase